MATFRRVGIEEFAGTINGGVEVEKIRLVRQNRDSAGKRTIHLVNGRLMYKTGNGTIVYVLPGDILYFKNGTAVELI